MLCHICSFLNTLKIWGSLIKTFFKTLQHRSDNVKEHQRIMHICIYLNIYGYISICNYYNKQVIGFDLNRLFYIKILKNDPFIFSTLLPNLYFNH